MPKHRNIRADTKPVSVFDPEAQPDGRYAEGPDSNANPSGSSAYLRDRLGTWSQALIHGKRLVVVMPAYNAESTVEKTLREIPEGFADDVVLVDDASRDQTAAVAARLGMVVLRHPKNRGYGGNQKTCYREALRLGGDVIVMLHPDYQYSPKLVVAMASMIASGQYDVVLGSRILCGSAIRGGMPIYKYVMNRILTLIQNLLMDAKVSEYHTGYRAFSRAVLETLPLEENSDDFVFDNEMLAQAFYFGFNTGELSCPTRYEPESSSISLSRSIKYGFGVLRTTVQYRLQKWGLASYSIFDKSGRRLALLEPAALEAVPT